MLESGLNDRENCKSLTEKIRELAADIMHVKPRPHELSNRTELIRKKASWSRSLKDLREELGQAICKILSEEWNCIIQWPAEITAIKKHLKRASAQPGSQTKTLLLTQLMHMQENPLMHRYID